MVGAKLLPNLRFFAHLDDVDGDIFVVVVDGHHQGHLLPAVGAGVTVKKVNVDIGLGWGGPGHQREQYAKSQDC
jgi:hypothetical protein